MNATLQSPSGVPDVVVVGGGIAGLAAAARVARDGRSVLLLEKAREPGGRAATTRHNGVQLNLGPHALYVHGHTFQMLKELGIPFRGRTPTPGQALAQFADRSYPLPLRSGTLLLSRMLSIREKLRLIRLLGRLPNLDARALDTVPVADWIMDEAGHGNLARYLGALLRLVTYGGDLDALSTGAALDQLRLSLAGNVWYLDGGWQTLVDGLREDAAQHGAVVQSHVRVDKVNTHREGVSLHLADGTSLAARTAILAVGPREACELLDLPESSAVGQFNTAAIPMRAACLDLALDALPRPKVGFALGMDGPYYYSVHSKTARLGPPNVAVVSVMKYLQPRDERSNDCVETELEGFLDRLQPGWQSHVMYRRLLPSIRVANSLPTARQGGLQGRPDVVVAERPGVFLAGDWVGSQGQLVDASSASAGLAARLAVATLSRRAGDATGLHSQGNLVHVA